VIVIFSNPREWSVNDVFDWVHYHFREKCEVVSDVSSLKTCFQFLEVSNANVAVQFRSGRVDGVWFRGYLYYDLPESFSKPVKRHIKEEMDAFLSSFFNTVNHTGARVLGTNRQDLLYLNVNKIKSLIVAAAAGLSIPYSNIAFDNHTIREVVSGAQRSFITKPVSNPIFLFTGDRSYSMYTSMIDEKKLAADRQPASPNLIQNYVRKKFELRIFYLHGKCYSAAIFSQSSDKTQVDFRNYDDDKPNRVVPYKLPRSITVAIRKFMKNMGLNTGSIDMIYGDDGVYYFLEVNPVGQYSMISLPCNFFLDEKIAAFLTSNECAA
jgi:ATP-GRASP peptide maturase of grasp-with-spasm system